MLFARSGKCQPTRAKRLNTKHLAGSQVVVCKIHQPPFFVPQALFPAISFHLLRVVLAISPPIVGVRLAPLLRALQADLLINRIGGDLLPMIIRAALALAGRLGANLFLRMITVRLKGLLTVTATAILHQAAPEENGKVHSLWKHPETRTRQEKISAETIEFLPQLCRWGCCLSPSTDSMTSLFDPHVRSEKASSLCEAAPFTGPAALSVRNEDRRLQSCLTPHNNTPGIIC